MFKAGASRYDKKRIVNLFMKGHSDDQISQLTSVRIEHVKAVLEQARAGKLSGGNLPYMQGEPGSDESHIMMRMTEQQNNDRMAELEARNAELNEKLDRLLAMGEQNAEPSVPESPPEPPGASDGAAGENPTGDGNAPVDVQTFTEGEADEQLDPELQEELAEEKAKPAKRKRRTAA